VCLYHAETEKSEGWQPIYGKLDHRHQGWSYDPVSKHRLDQQTESANTESANSKLLNAKSHQTSTGTSMDVIFLDFDKAFDRVPKKAFWQNSVRLESEEIWNR
jgi:hypothetical protein